MENNINHNYLEELLNLFKMIGFSQSETKLKNSYFFTYKRTIVLEDMNHSSDLEWYAYYTHEENQPTDEILISLRLTLYNSKETVNMNIKNFIAYIKHEFKYDLRNYKINKLLTNEH